MEHSPIIIISIIVASGLFIMVGTFTLGTLDNSFKCSQINNTNGNSGCTNTKTLMWNVWQIVPLILVFLILGIFGISRMKQ